MSEFVIPDKVKEILSRLPVADQVVLRGYIAGMRDMAKEYKAKAEHGEHAHFHGDEICTTNHGHTHEHADEEMACDGNHDHGHAHGHDHKDEGIACDGNHDHGHAHGHDHKESHSHGGENKHGHEKESHAHEHKHQEHAHDHDHKKKEGDIPAWKKRALESGGDASAAPFGGSWNTESSLDATKK